MTTTPTTLYSYVTKEPLSLRDAIAACKESLKGAIALLYSPQQCYLAQLAPDGTLRDARDREVDLASVFEGRIFNESCELRWLNHIDGLGDTALIAESKQTIEGFSETEAKACESLEQQYLLWGEKAKNKPGHKGWQRLAEARVGKLDIPLNQALQKDQRVYLKTHEYLAAADKYGNVVVIEERLMKLEANS